MSSGREVVKRYNLVTGESTYSSQTSQEPTTSRRLRGFIPSLAGDLKREAPVALFAAVRPATYAGGIKEAFEFDYNNEQGQVVREYYCVTGQYTSGGTTYSPALYKWDGAAWAAVSAVILQAIPVYCVINNLLHLSDGYNSWLYNGAEWSSDGIPIPLFAATLKVNASGKLNVTTNRYYWFSFADHTKGRVHESSSSPISAASGSVSNGSITVTPCGGLCDSDGDNILKLRSPEGLVAKVITTAVRSGNVITVTTSTAHGFAVGWQVIQAQIDDSSFNGTFTIATVPSGTTYTVAQNGPDASTTNGLAEGVGAWTIKPMTRMAPRYFYSPGRVSPPPYIYTVHAVAYEYVERWGTYDIYRPWTGDVNLRSDLTNWRAVDGTGGLGSSNSLKALPNDYAPTEDWYQSGGLQDTYATSGLERRGGIVTCTVTVAHNITPGQTITVRNTGTMGIDSGNVDQPQTAYDASFDGTFVCATAPSGTTLTWYQSGDDANSGGGSVTVGTPVMSSAGRSFINSGVVGWKVYFPGATEILVRTILAIAAPSADPSHNTYLTLDDTIDETISGQQFLIAPPRATHWHLYASESEGSKLGYLLGELPVTQFNFVDQSPWRGEDGSSFQKFQRPLRNDPTPASLIMEVHKYRIFRRRESQANFFMFTAKEEVDALLNGAAEECVPGADVNTLSDILNEQSYPRTTAQIRNMTSHADALYIGTEKELIPLLGETIDDFAFSEVTAMHVGVAGRRSACSTHHGLAFISYDRKAYVYPILMQSIGAVQSQEQLVEIGRPKRNTLKNIDPAKFDEIDIVHYNFGERDWLVVSFCDLQGSYETWVFDFDTKGWFPLQKGVMCVSVWEVSAGNKVLIGGGTDGYLYVLDDQTGTYSSEASFPEGIFRPALIDFGNPEINHRFAYVEYEVTDADLDIEVNFWLDPEDVDNPGDARTITMSPVLGSNRFRGFPEDGSICHRLLLEFKVPSGGSAAAIRGVKLVAEPMTDLVVGM